MKDTATIILNRNLPEITDALHDRIMKYDKAETDIFILESGSSKKKLSKNHTWHADSKEDVETGLRYARGFNYALTKLYEEKKLDKYKYIFLVCNDVQFPQQEPIVKTLREEIEKHPRIGILSPCADNWGEKQLMTVEKVKYFGDVQFLSWFIRKECLLDIMTPDKPSKMNFLFDGSNFRGYAADLEVITKAYVNDWAAGISRKVIQIEDDSPLKTKADLMGTDPYDVNLRKMVEDGTHWMRAKYGFHNRWSFQAYSKFFYDQFFVHFPEYKEFKV
ncbi:MAG: hypothetical protein O3C63_06900 [Cyanobacteria bacterium]|nr:hypothetical protein [Cyanobacteriota bacterium]